MNIKEVTIKKYGKLEQRTLEFGPGINLVYGENETGKSTLQSFLKSMLFGLEKQRGRAGISDEYSRYAPWDAPSYYAGAMVFETGGKDFRLERNFYHKEKTAKLWSLSDLEELSVEKGDLSMLLGGISKEAYVHTCCITQAQLDPGKTLQQMLRDESSNLTETGDGSFRLSKAVQNLDDKKKELTNRQQTFVESQERKQKELRIEADMLSGQYQTLRGQQEQLSEQLQPAMQDAYRKDQQLQQLEQQVMQQEQTAMQECQKLEKQAAVLAQKIKQVQDEKQKIVMQQKLDAQQNRAGQQDRKMQQSRKTQQSRQTQKSGTDKTAAIHPLIVLGVAVLLLNGMLKTQLALPTVVWGLIQVIAVVLVVVGFGQVIGKRRQASMETFEQPEEEESRASTVAQLDVKKANLLQQWDTLQQLRQKLEVQLLTAKQDLSALQKENKQHCSSAKQAYQTAKQIEVSIQAKLEYLEEELRQRELQIENNRQQQEETAAEPLEVREIARDLQAVQLAKERLLVLAKEVQQFTTGELMQRTGRIFAQMTGGSYDKIGLSDQYQPQVYIQETPHRPDDFSYGTMQQLYFAYRMAAGAVLCREEPLPFLLDEPFVFYDTKRLVSTLQWLAKQESQVILFTCRQTEAQMLAQMGIDYQRIELR